MEKLQKKVSAVDVKIFGAKIYWINEIYVCMYVYTHNQTHTHTIITYSTHRK